MYTVGEFAHLAHVSKRLLRYYDEINLFKPEHIDAMSGYRYYSPTQMPVLNQILALKELGLTLSQIQRTLSDDISSDELEGMLRLRKAEIEQHLIAEQRRIREIEARLESIRNDEMAHPTNVIVKQTPSINALSVRRTMEDFMDAIKFYTRLQASVSKNHKDSQFFCICRSDTDTIRNLDLEFGVYVNKHDGMPLEISQEMILTPAQLPACEMMATTVVTGPLETIHRGYAEIVRWSVTKGYRLKGEHRELCLQMAKQSDGCDLITEIQVPVVPLPLTDKITLPQG